MRRIKRAAHLASSAVVAFSSILTMGFTGVAHATSGSDTCVWTGATNLLFSTASNWSGCSGAAPVAGDILSFGTLTPTSGNSKSVVLTNDISAAFGGVTISQTGSHNITTYFISGLTLAAGTSIVDSQTASAYYTSVYLGASYSSTAVLTALGDLTLVGVNHMRASSYNVAGKLTIPTGMRFFNTISAGSVVVQNGATLFVDPGTNANPTFTVPITLGGGTGSVKPEVEFDAICGAGQFSCNYSPATWTVSGAITLLSDAYILPGDQATVNVTGAISGAGFTLLVDPSATGTLTLNPSSNNSNSTTGSQTPAAVTNTISDSQPTVYLTVGNNVTDILDGSRGGVNVSKGGTLKGTGTAQNLWVNKGGTVAPGHSPGKFTVLNEFNLADGATYQAELKDVADGDYDKIAAGNATQTDSTNPDGIVVLGDEDGTTHTVTGNPTLTVSLYSGYKIDKGDQFTIIDNLSQTAVKGTFANLPEGATFKTAEGYVFAISYKGGDGNDVVLTAQSVPATPDTGFALAAAHPGATLGVTALAAGTIFAIARRNRKATARR